MRNYIKRKSYDYESHRLDNETAKAPLDLLVTSFLITVTIDRYTKDRRKGNGNEANTYGDCRCNKIARAPTGAFCVNGASDKLRLM